MTDTTVEIDWHRVNNERVRGYKWVKFTTCLIGDRNNDVEKGHVRFCGETSTNPREKTYNLDTLTPEGKKIVDALSKGMFEVWSDDGYRWRIQLQRQWGIVDDGQYAAFLVHIEDSLRNAIPDVTFVEGADMA